MQKIVGQSTPHVDLLKTYYGITPRQEPLTKAARSNSSYLHNLYLERKILVAREQAPLAYAKIEAVLALLTDTIGITNHGFNLHIIEDYFPNAFIVNGSGDIYVTTEMLKKEELTKGELASILSHELGHYLKSFLNVNISSKAEPLLYKAAFAWTARARCQFNEFDSDEIGLILMDMAGFSVDESLSMAGKISRKKTISGTKAKFLDPFNSHPDWPRRKRILHDNINNPKFCWKNRKAKTECLFCEGDLAPFDEKPVEESKDANVFEEEETLIASISKRWSSVSGYDPLSEEAVDAIAEKVFIEPDSEVYECYYFLRNKDIVLGEGLKNNILALKRRVGQNDVVASIYLKALLCKVYSDSTKGMVEKKIEWLKNECEVEPDEVIVALLELLEDIKKYFKRMGFFDPAIVEDNRFDSDYAGCPRLLEKNPFGFTSLEASIAPFPYSRLRDEYILALLSVGFIKDHDKYLESNFIFEEDILEHIKFELFPLLCNPFASSEMDNMRQEFCDEKLNNDTAYDITEKGFLARLEFTVLDGWPYSLIEFEAALTDDINARKWLFRMEEIQNGQSDDPLEEGTFVNRYQRLKAAADRHPIHFVRDRILKFARIFFLREFEMIPAAAWSSDSLSIIESFPPSSEKNHLLVILDQGKRRKLKKSELFFEELKMADNALSFEDIVDSFGFISSSASSVFYPSGQRMADRIMIGCLPADRALDLAEICGTVPRPSPIRDEALDRVVPSNLPEAERLLDAYFNPVAAYAKAYQIAGAWMEQLNGDDNLSVFNDICELTKNFPSLRKRVVIEWTNRFGIKREAFPHIVRSYSLTGDFTDIGKGLIVKKAAEMGRELKIAVCLGTFATSLSRNNFAFISMQRPANLKDLSTNNVDEVLVRDQKLRALKDYLPILPENVVEIASVIAGRIPYSLHTIPFVDDEPFPHEIFKRGQLEEETLAEGVRELNEWKGAKVFSNFMKALGWEESGDFYEELLVDIAQDGAIFSQLEEIFTTGINLLLQAEKVPLGLVQSTAEGVKLLIDYQAMDIKIKIWAKILAGIAQKQPIEEITREALRPIGILGYKILQASNSLVAGGNETLEKASRAGLSDTLSIGLFDSLLFLAFRGFDLFLAHDKYTLLGSGSIRTAIAGLGGNDRDEAFLLVHALPIDPAVKNNLMAFVRQLRKKNSYFPLTPEQLRELAFQSELERKMGFERHEAYGEFFGWKLGQVLIPHIYEKHGDWARLEIARGVPFHALAEARMKAVSPVIIEGALKQFDKHDGDFSFLVNPEFHRGNLVVTDDNSVFLVDCGLTGKADANDVLSFFGVLSAFRTQGLFGAAAKLFEQNGITSLSQIPPVKRSGLLDNLNNIYGRREALSAPELLLSELAIIVKRAGRAITEGFDLLSRGLQHLAPYFRFASTDIPQLSLIPTSSKKLNMAVELELLKTRAKEARKSLTGFLSGTEVGKKLSKGSIQTIGVLIEPTEVIEDDSSLKGFILCNLGSSKAIVSPRNLLAKIGGKWVPYEEFLKSS